MLKSCQKCGAPVENPDQHFCQQCGAPLAQQGTPPPSPPVTCRACGTPLKPGEKFCSNCLVMIQANGPQQTQSPPPQATPAPVKSPVSPVVSSSPAPVTCRACGTPLKPGEKFCSNCLVMVQTGAPQHTQATPPPAAPAPVKPPVSSVASRPPASVSPAPVKPPVSPVSPVVSRPPAPVSPAPASPALQKGGLPVKSIAIAGIIGLVLLVGIVVLFSDDDTGQPVNSPAAAGDQLPREQHDLSDQSISAQDVQLRNQALSEVAAALDSGDNQAVFSGLSAGTREKYGSGLGLSSDEAAALAGALRSARPVTEYPHSTLYEARVDGKTLSFVMWKEEGSWKISGL